MSWSHKKNYWLLGQFGHALQERCHFVLHRKHVHREIEQLKMTAFDRVHAPHALRDRDVQSFKQLGFNNVAAAITPATNNGPQNTGVRLSPMEGTGAE